MTAPIRTSVVLATAIATALIATPLRAEDGDYSFWQTLVNLVSPPPADNKVTAAQQTGLPAWMQQTSDAPTPPPPASKAEPSWLDAAGEHVQRNLPYYAVGGLGQGSALAALGTAGKGRVVRDLPLHRKGLCAGGG